MREALAVDLPRSARPSLADLSGDMAFDPGDPTSKHRREVGLFARKAWSAVQETLVRFRDVKQQRDSAALRETRRACDEALLELDRLQRALRSLGRAIHRRRGSIAAWEDHETHRRESVH